MSEKERWRERIEDKKNWRERDIQYLTKRVLYIIKVPGKTAISNLANLFVADAL